MQCNDTSPHGCARCSPKPVLVCCDLCHPAAFEGLHISPRNVLKQIRKSHIKTYNPGLAERELRATLLSWRDGRAKELFNPQLFSDLGGKLFMPAPIIQRIIDCAHGGKLTSIADIRKEVAWQQDWIDIFGDAILDMVHISFPPPPSVSVPPSVPAQSSVPQTDGPPPAAGAAPTSEPEPISGAQMKKRRPPTCSRCGETGHTSKSILCAST